MLSLSLAGVLGLASAIPAHAETKPVSVDVDEARARFQRGVDLFHEGSFDAALAEFEKAYELAPNYRLLYNLAQVQNERHDYVAALRFFEKYLAQGDAEIPPDRKEQVQRDVAALKTRVAVLAVTSNVDGGELVVDGASIGVLPTADPVLVSAGVRRLELRKQGFVPASRTVTVAGGEVMNVDFRLDPVGAEPRVASSAPAGGVSQPDASRAEKPEEHGRLPFWVTLGSTVVLTGGAVSFGVLTHRADQNLTRELGKFPANQDAIDHARSDLRRDALITDLFTASAIVSGGAFLYFALSGPGGASESHDTALRVAPTLGGATAFGRF